MDVQGCRSRRRLSDDQLRPFLPTAFRRLQQRAHGAGETVRRVHTTTDELTSANRHFLLILRKTVLAAFHDIGDSFDRIPDVDVARVQRCETEATQIRWAEIADNTSVACGANNRESVGVP